MGRRDDRHRKRSPEKPDDPDPFHLASPYLPPRRILVRPNDECTPHAPGGPMGIHMPGAGFEPARPQWGHLILSQARMTNFATPARAKDSGGVRRR